MELTENLRSFAINIDTMKVVIPKGKKRKELWLTDEAIKTVEAKAKKKGIKSKAYMEALVYKDCNRQ